MATTTNYALTLLDIGQKNKETSINTNFTLLDAAIPKYLGDLETAPTDVTHIPLGSTFYKPSLQRVFILRSKAAPTEPLWSPAYTYNALIP